MRGNTPERSCTKLNSCLGLNPFFPLEVVSVNSLVSILPDGFYDLTCLDVQVKKRAVILCVCVIFVGFLIFIYLFTYFGVSKPGIEPFAFFFKTVRLPRSANWLLSLVVCFGTLHGAGCRSSFSPRDTWCFLQHGSALLIVKRFVVYVFWSLETVLGRVCLVGIAS